METTQQLIAALTTAIANLQNQSTANASNLHFEPYNESEEPFPNYIKRLENYLALRNISDVTKKRQVLINCIGAKYYQLLSNLTAPDEPDTKSYEFLIDVLKNHLSPKPNEITEQHKFLLRLQHEGESITSFLAELKKLSFYCNFACESCKKSTLDTHLRSQFIRGLRDSDIKERLLQEKDLTLDKALSIAIGIESSKTESRTMNSIHQVQIRGKTGAPAHGNQNAHENARKTSYNSHTEKGITCFRCGKPDHMANKCRATNLFCKKCRKTGHNTSVCKKWRSSPRDANALQVITDDEDDDYTEGVYRPHEINALKLANEEVEGIHALKVHRSCVDTHGGKYFINLKINGIPFDMELDTGAAISVMNLNTFTKHWPNAKIEPTKVMLKTYNNDVFPALGKSEVEIECDKKKITSQLYLVQGKFDSLMGREWVNALNLLGINSINTIAENRDVERMKLKIFNEFSDLFEQKVGTIPDFKGVLKLREGTLPIFVKAREAPYAIRSLIEEEIRRLEKEGILEKVEHSDWGTPIVPVIKADKSVRLCADYKVTLNKCIINDNYPIAKIQELYDKLKGGVYFCTFDIYKAYLHLSMSDESALMQTISTTLGLYKVKKLMFGVKTAPNIWTRVMDNMLRDLKGVAWFFDDIIVTAKSLDELFDRCLLLLNVLRKFNIHLNTSKCRLFQKSVVYLGHKIDKDGLHKTKEKIEAIISVKPPTQLTELRQFLGMVNYYHKFIPDLSTKLHPLYKLLRKDQTFNWTPECQHSFDGLKNEMMSDNVLIPFDEKLPLLLSTDASPFGLSAILSHLTDLGERPIAYASRSLSKTETNYSQLDKEATAIFWGLHKFFNYCYGREFTLITDNKPLTSILHPSKNLPLLTAQRLLHYAQFLSGFKYTIQYRSTKEHTNADFLSRNPINDIDVNSSNLHEIYQLWNEYLPVTHKDILDEIKNDKELSSLIINLQTGASLKGTIYESMASELMLQDGCVYRGIRVVIPTSLRAQVLNELHEAHIGIVKMKALARSYCYWPGIDRDIEELVSGCRDCARVSKEPTKIITHPWEVPTQPWHRIHVDFAGPFMERYFLVVVDAKTKWLEVFPMSRITSFHTICSLREVFARFGIPRVLVSDNGSNFTSKEFQDFLKYNNISHKRTSPAHPSTNGQAERFVQILKSGLRASRNDSGDLHTKLHRLLVQYRKTTSSTTGESPAEMMLRYTYRTRLDLMRPSILENEGTPVCKRNFNIGDLVQVRFYQNKECRWKFGKVTQRDGHLHYIVDVDGASHRRHIDQMKRTLVEGNFPNRVSSFPIEDQVATIKGATARCNSTPSGRIGEDEVKTSCKATDVPSISTEETGGGPESKVVADPGNKQQELTEPRRSKRIRTQPVRYQPM